MWLLILHARVVFLFNDTPTTEIYTLSLHDALPIWGLDRVLEKGKGTVVLFAGAPGTGKTMTAEAMAHRLGRPLHIADYAELESKWIGETEKNIVEIFRAAREAGAVLLL